MLTLKRVVLTEDHSYDFKLSQRVEGIVVVMKQVTTDREESKPSFR